MAFSGAAFNHGAMEPALKQAEYSSLPKSAVATVSHQRLEPGQTFLLEKLSRSQNARTQEHNGQKGSTAESWKKKRKKARERKYWGRTEQITLKLLC